MLDNENTSIPKDQIDLLLTKANIELIQRVDKQILLLDQKREAIEKINEYLTAGGLVKVGSDDRPELMDPQKVRDLLVEVRDIIAGTRKPE